MASVTAGTKTVSSAGTRVQVTTTPTPVRRIRFQAPPGNSGITYVGISTVSSSVAGIEFAAAGGSETVDFTEGRQGIFRSSTVTLRLTAIRFTTWRF